eukprot:CAMPEP_0170573042 /NCGR_PEP_ID=MMETSP0224-20130122/2550_1 /TAXON_ID=285029 /ORGANISM="Togula jolla, Strain CCCM 725" /LENGTH=424 /DNA_ID=CAMNT_0010895595 /DNA_START=171 /DNA_END=1443 /DNA_ORIENTATION=-
MSDRFGRRPMLVGGLFLVGCGITGLGFATCYEHLLLLRVCSGVGIASTYTAASMYISDISHPMNSARTRAPMSMGVSAGMLVGPAIGGFLLEEIGLHSTALGVGVATFTTAAATCALLPESLVTSRGPTSHGSVLDAVKSWGPIVRDPRLRRVLMWVWCYNAAFWGAVSLLPMIYVDLAFSPTVVGGIFTTSAVMNLLATPVVARAADKFGKMRVVIPGALIYGGCLVLIPSAGSLVELLPILAAMQLATAMCSQAHLYAMDITPSQDRAKIPALWNTVGDTGMLLSSFASSALAQASTTGVALYMDGALLLVATALTVGAQASDSTAPLSVERAVRYGDSGFACMAEAPSRRKLCLRVRDNGGRSLFHPKCFCAVLLRRAEAWLGLHYASQLSWPCPDQRLESSHVATAQEQGMFASNACCRW